MTPGTGRAALLACVSFLLGACGGSNSGDWGGVKTVAVSGTVSYEFVPTNAGCHGLNFNAIEVRPIRGATVQLIDAASGTEIARTTSSAVGTFSISGIRPKIKVQLRVRAELKDSSVPGWDVEVRDNFIAGASDYDNPAPPSLSTRALYTLNGASFDSGTGNVQRNLTATTGWDGASYSGPRAAAPFALLDTAYTSMQFVRDFDASANFAPLDMFWSVNNTPGDGRFDITAGEIGTSGYLQRDDSLLVLGDAAIDTDEFDGHVVAHEWGHYFEDVLARSNSEGGAHFLGESLDASVAFSEGFAEALASMIQNDPINCDTFVPGTPGGGGFTVEGNSFGQRGWFNEVSVATLIWDLWDTGDDGIDVGSLGFRPIYDTMVGPHTMSDSFATLFSFATELRASLNAPDAALLDALLNREEVVTGADLDIWASSETNDAGVAQEVFPLYVPYTADGSLVNVCVNNQLDGFARHGNNVGENRYLRITVPVDDEYDVNVVTTTATPPSADPHDRDFSDPDIIIYHGSVPEEIARAETDDVQNMEPTFRTPMLLSTETYLAFVEEWRFHDALASTTFPQRICFDVSLTPTP
jgi:hypothetical protein